ncbi:MAG TPA: hypothetical protein ENJ19_05770 [Gammaproteobacteria bacterium]|nr:hypothetical protein [Gammaproteobacteria bacterium]
MSDLEISAFFALFTLGLGFLFFYWVWQQYVIDSTRQQLFELRDALFDLASDGEISYDSEAYVILRKMFNTYIRFAHELNWIHVVAYMMLARQKRGEISRSALRVEHLIKEILDRRARKKVEEMVAQLHMVSMWHIVRRSLLLMLMVPIVFIISFFFMASANVVAKLYKKLGVILDAKAYSEATS